MERPTISKFCAECSKTFVSTYNYNQHVKSKHSTELYITSFPCPQKNCSKNKTFKFLKNLKEHLKKEHRLTGSRLNQAVHRIEPVRIPNHHLTNCSVVIMKTKSDKKGEEPCEEPMEEPCEQSGGGPIKSKPNKIRRSARNINKVTKPCLKFPDKEPRKPKMTTMERNKMRNHVRNTVMTKRLKLRKLINWWDSPPFTEMSAIDVTPDGNCLIHAVSVIENGTEDKLFEMRYDVHQYLIDKKNELEPIFTLNEKQKHAAANFTLSEEQTENEWRNFINDMGNHHKSLESFHVFLVCNYLMRPIIVMAPEVHYDAFGNAITAIDLGGIYLPLLLPPEQCHSPIYLAFLAGHFCALNCSASPSMVAPVKNVVKFSVQLDNVEETLKRYIPVLKNVYADHIVIATQALVDSIDDIDDAHDVFIPTGYQNKELEALDECNIHGNISYSDNEQIVFQNKNSEAEANAGGEDIEFGHGLELGLEHGLEQSIIKAIYNIIEPYRSKLIKTEEKSTQTNHFSYDSISKLPNDQQDEALLHLIGEYDDDDENSNEATSSATSIAMVSNDSYDDISESLHNESLVDNNSPMDLSNATAQNEHNQEHDHESCTDGNSITSVAVQQVSGLESNDLVDNNLPMDLSNATVQNEHNQEHDHESCTDGNSITSVDVQQISGLELCKSTDEGNFAYPPIIVEHVVEDSVEDLDRDLVIKNFESVLNRGATSTSNRIYAMETSALQPDSTKRSLRSQMKFTEKQMLGLLSNKTASGRKRKSDQYMEPNQKTTKKSVKPRKTNDMPSYKKIESNINRVTRNGPEYNECQCRYEDPSPCGIESNCQNALLKFECDPDLCPAQNMCRNKNFHRGAQFAFEVKMTQSNGWGLYAKEDIPSDQFIVEYMGEVVDKAEFDRRFESAKNNNADNYYFFALENGLYIDAAEYGNVARFINHSCEPNSSVIKWTVFSNGKGQVRVGCFSNREIRAGEEITFDYKWNGQQMCKCGAKNCRHKI